MERLKNKIAIITGGARGIGKTTVELFSEQGATVIIWDLLESEGSVLADEITKKGKKTVFAKVNITDYASVEAAAKDVFEEFGKIDILVNNAGITSDATLQKMTTEQWQKVIDVNLTGVFNCTKAVSQFMIGNNYGRIINTSSVVGVYGNFGQTNYVATKAGIIGMTKVWARELGRKGITVNAVAPGFIATEMIDSVPEKVITSLKEKTPLGRLGNPIDIANAYLYLASDEASFVNGITLSVDGGLVI